MKLSQETRETLKDIASSSAWKAIEALQGVCLNKLQDAMMAVRLEDQGQELYRRRLMLEGAKELVKMINRDMEQNKKETE
jgi:hypothetical protein